MSRTGSSTGGESVDVAIDDGVPDAEPLPESEIYVVTLPATMSAERAREYTAAWMDHWQKWMPGRKLIVLGGGATIAPLSHLDAAWAEAEAALPEGWLLLEMSRRRIGEGLRKIVWHAVAGPESSDWKGVQPERVTADETEPAAALRSLAAKLWARQSQS